MQSACLILPWTLPQSNDGSHRLSRLAWGIGTFIRAMSCSYSSCPILFDTSLSFCDTSLCGAMAGLMLPPLSILQVGFSPVAEPSQLPSPQASSLGREGSAALSRPRGDPGLHGLFTALHERVGEGGLILVSPLLFHSFACKCRHI